MRWIVSVNLLVMNLIPTKFTVYYYAYCRNKDYSKNGSENYDRLLWIICAGLSLAAIITSSMCVTIITTDTLLYQKKVIRIARSALKAANRCILIDACCTGRTASTESTFNKEIEEKHFVNHFLTINYEWEQSIFAISFFGYCIDCLEWVIILIR